jgi:hypothetical protein
MTKMLFERLDTKQKVYDYVCQKMIEQGKTSLRDGICVYRADGGSRCAIGHLIPDSIYRKSIFDEGNQSASIGFIFGRNFKFNTNLNEYQCRFRDWYMSIHQDHENFLNFIQLRLHDNLSQNENFLNEFKEAAEEFALDNNLIPYKF